VAMSLAEMFKKRPQGLINPGEFKSTAKPKKVELFRKAELRFTEGSHLAVTVPGLDIMDGEKMIRDFSLTDTQVGELNNLYMGLCQKACGDCELFCGLCNGLSSMSGKSGRSGNIDGEYNSQGKIEELKKVLSKKALCKPEYPK
jgi:hypothetical protein